MDKPLRILILEDNPADAELMQFELQEAGLAFDAKTVVSKEEFVRELQEFSPDLILSDYDLPQYSGLLALREARKRCPGIPFILVTGAVSEDRAIEILTQGAKDYVLKSRLQRLVPAIRRSLAEAEEHRARTQAEAELLEARSTLEASVKIRTAELEAEIVARKNAEDALRESESREKARAEELQAFIDAVPGIVFIAHDADCHKMTGSTATERFLRLNPQSNVSKSAPHQENPMTFTAMKNGMEVPPEALPVHQAAKGHEVRDYELDIVFNDGVVRTILGNASPVFNESGKPRGAIAVFTEVTERKRMEKSLRRMTERMDMAQRAAGVGTWDWDLLSGQIEWSDKMFDLFGLDSRKQPASFKLWRSILHPEDVEIASLRIEESQEQQSTLDSDYRIILPNGRIRWINSVGEAKYDDKGRPVRMIGICTDITERKQAEDILWKALEESERNRAFLETVVSAQVDVVIIYDNHMNVQKVNPAFIEIYGFDPKGLHVTDIMQRVACRSLDGQTVNMEDNPTPQALTGDRVTGLRFEVIRADGSEGAVEVTSGPILLEDRIIGAVTVWHDISELRKHEEALRESEELFRTIASHSPDHIIIQDRNLRYQLVIQPQLNLTEADMLGKTDFDILEREDAEKLTAIKQKVLETGQPIAVETTLTNTKGESEFFEGVYVPKSGPAGETDGLIGYFRNITKRKHTEEKLRHTEQISRAIGESIDYGVWVCKPDGRNLFASDSFLKLLGLTQEQYSNVGWVDMLHPDDVERTIAAWKECARKEGAWDIENRFRGVDGQWHTILARGVPVRDNEGKVTCWVGINLDIQNFKEIEKALQDKSQQLEDANKELESFSYSISHDLKAPLRTIDGYSRMLVKKHGETLEEDAVRLLNIIRSNTEKMSALIDDLLSFSRVLQNSITVSEIDMNGLAGDVWDEIREAYPDRQFDFRSENLLPGFGDKKLIRQVLFNLFANAVKFTKHRKPSIIEVSSSLENGKVTYCLKDNGVGFDMAYHDKLFGIFQRLHSAEEFEGTGAGLAIVHRIIKRHGGQVWAEGNVDEGAAFYFTLPLQECRLAP